MKAATERKIIRWFHILASIPILGYIYGPVSTIPQAAFTTKVIILPAVVLSGFWLWLGRHVRKRGRGPTAKRIPSSPVMRSSKQ